ncbi:MAG: sensor histidine kinase [Gemmatimonadota bacterium]
MHAAEAVPDGLAGFDSVWIAAGPRPLEVARKVAALDPAVQSIVVSPPEDIGVHERSLLFTPGLGEVWLVEPGDVGQETLERARELTATRRRYRRNRHRFSQMTDFRAGGGPRRAVVSDAYLATLLRVLPDPVLSVDESDRVVSWSEAAERLLAIPRGRALGQGVADVVPVEDRHAFRRALERGRIGTVRLDLTLAGARGRLITEAVITPVEAGGVNVRAVVLRNVTRERESMAQLEREVDLRTRSYAAMSHEIRTPINAIMGYIELLRSGIAAPGKQAEYLERSQKAAAHLLSLVNDILDLSKIESGALEIRPAPTPVDQVIHQLVGTVEPLARERDTPLEVHCGPNPGTFSTDARRLHQILINLVSNALKFGQGRPVSVRCDTADGAVVFEVEDRGAGIEPREQERIFQEFSQVGDPGEGTGLGLPISRKLTALLGGELTVDSEPGRGSTFRLRLPRHPPEQAG